MSTQSKKRGILIAGAIAAIMSTVIPNIANAWLPCELAFAGSYSQASPWVKADCTGNPSNCCRY